jgi:RND family efflux transporter MFP subunit
MSLWAPCRRVRLLHRMKPLPLSVLTLLLTLLAGCKPPAAMQMPPPPVVTVAHPAKREVVEYDQFTGRLDAVEMVEVRARVGGELKSVHFSDGAEVKAGDLLFQIDPDTYAADVARTEAQVRQTEAQLTLARSEFARAETLLKTRTISDQEHNNWRLRVGELEAAHKAAGAALDTARLRLGYSRVTAPISGKVGRRLVTPGNLVSEPPFQPTLLTTLVSQDPIYCYIDVDERTFLKYQALARAGQRNGQIPVEVAVSDEVGFPHRGVIDFTDNHVNPATGTIRLRASVPNADRKLTPGLFARMQVPGSAKYEALTVPETAVFANQGLKLVMTVGVSNLAEMRPVVVGAAIDGVRVIREGLTAGDQVVVNGRARVMQPGMPVTPVPDTNAPSVVVNP